MTVYELKKDGFEIKAGNIRSTGDIESAFLLSDFGGKTLLKTSDEAAAIADINKYTSTARRASGAAGSLICGDIYYIEKYEASAEGEFISGADFIFAKWSEEALQCF